MGYNSHTNHLSNQSSKIEFYSERLFAQHTKSHKKQTTNMLSLAAKVTSLKKILKQKNMEGIWYRQHHMCCKIHPQQYV